MTAPRSSLVSLFLPPSFFDLCLHVGGHDDLAIAVPACAVRGSLFAFDFLFAVCRSLLFQHGLWASKKIISGLYFFCVAVMPVMFKFTSHVLLCAV